MGLTQRHARVAAIVFQGIVVVGCGAVGWRLAHPPSSESVRLHPPANAPVVFAPRPAQPVLAAAPAPKATGKSSRPGLEDMVQRVNRDDAGLYREQWRAAQLVGAGTRSYIEGHIVPLLLAAARGGNR